MEKEELYKKISRYCAYQERCRSEVMTKGLRAKLIDSKLIETVLKEEVNEEDYRELLNKTLTAKGPQTALSRGFEPYLVSEYNKTFLD